MMLLNAITHQHRAF